MTRTSARPSLALRIAPLVLALAAPAAAPAQPFGPSGPFTTVARSWSFAGCGRGEVVVRPEPILGDVVCVDGVATWGQAGPDAMWLLWLDIRETAHPELTVGPSLRTSESFLSFVYAAGRTQCSGECRATGTLVAIPPDGTPWTKAVVNEPGALVALDAVDPESVDVTELRLLYTYLPRGADGAGEWGVLVQATPTVVPEPTTFLLTGSALTLLGAFTARRRGRS